MLVCHFRAYHGHVLRPDGAERLMLGGICVELLEVG